MVDYDAEEGDEGQIHEVFESVIVSVDPKQVALSAHGWDENPQSKEQGGDGEEFAVVFSGEDKDEDGADDEGVDEF